MKSSPLEPGLIQIFRWFVGLRLLMLLPSVIFQIWGQAGRTFSIPAVVTWVSLIDVMVLFIYVFWPPIQIHWGRAFLPVGIVLSSLGPLIEQYLMIRYQNVEMASLAGGWQLVILLLFPLILTSAQYKFRHVVLFTVLTHFADLGLSIRAIFASTAGNSALLSTNLYRVGAVSSLRTAIFFLVGFMIVRLMASQRQQRLALTQANQQLAHYAATLEQLTLSRERNRLARELHDTLAHSLSGVAVQLEAVKSLWNEEPAAGRQMLDQALGATRSGLTETRRALQALRATPLEDLGLALSISNLAESLARRTGIEMDLHVDEALNGFAPDVEQAVYRVAQEAMENIARHAHATRVSVHLAAPDNELHLTIVDDGCGFDPTAPEAAARFGLNGMRERTQDVGGKLVIRSQPGQGTTIELVCGGKA